MTGQSPVHVTGGVNNYKHNHPIPVKPELTYSFVKIAKKLGDLSCGKN